VHRESLPKLSEQKSFPFVTAQTQVILSKLGFPCLVPDMRPPEPIRDADTALALSGRFLTLGSPVPDRSCRRTRSKSLNSPSARPIGRQQHG
jgi:hypothetical protein